MRVRVALLLGLVCLLAATPSAVARERSMFVSQQLGATGTAWYSVDLDTGALTKNGGMIDSGAQPTVPGISPDGRFVYIGDYANAQLRGFAIDGSGLTELAGSPVASGAGPNVVVVDPAGGHLWSVNATDGNLSGFGFAGDGALSTLAGFPVASGDTTLALAVSPQHGFVYAANFSGASITGFRRGSDGSMTALSGSPFAVASGPIDVEFSVDGRFLFVADESDDAISAFAVDQSSGDLSPVPGQPFAAPDEVAVQAATPNGEQLIVGGLNGDVWSYAIAADGALSPITQTTAGNSPNDVTITPDGRFAYVANLWDGTMSGYSISNAGELDELPGSPFGDSSGAVATFAIVPNQGPVAAATSSASGFDVSFDASQSSDPDGHVASYVWNFGDGHSEVSSSDHAAHSFAAPGTYDVNLTVIDDENCSDAQIGTGQTLYCNGSAAARWHKAIVIAEPEPPFVLRLTEASARQARTQRRGRSRVRRVSARFRLNTNARVSYRFQKFCRTSGCRRNAPAHLHGKARFRNFGRRVTLSARTGRNSRIFTRRLGGTRLTPGIYRIRMQATNSSGQRTRLVTTRRFRVR
jgi:6-phosphogluconolactonase (cycloisomerase 2 family)